MEHKKRKKRDAPISYRPPSSLKAEFEERVMRSGLSTSAYNTKAVFGSEMPRQVRRPPVEKQILARQLAVLDEIRDQIRALQKQSREEEHGADEALARNLEEIAGRLTEMRTLSLRAMGRTP